MTFCEEEEEERLDFGRISQDREIFCIFVFWWVTFCEEEEEERLDFVRISQDREPPE